MAGIFKSYYAPDGVAITDANCIFATVGGSDSNSGTRLSPVGTITKAFTLLTGTKVYICFRGKTTENPTRTFITHGTVYMFGDDDSAFIDGTLTMTCAVWNVTFSLANFKVGNLAVTTTTPTLNVKFVSNLIVTGILNTQYTHVEKTIATVLQPNGASVNSSTILGYKNYNSISNLPVSNSIFTSYVDLYPYGGNYTYLTAFGYSLIRKSTQWRWNGANIPITYTAATGVTETDSAQWKIDIFNTLTTYYNSLSAGNPKTYLGSVLSNWATVMPGTAKVVDDINGINIFNRYQDGAPVDYSLKLVTGNSALYMSGSDSYVGKYAANIFGTLGSIFDVDSNGVNTSNTPTMLGRGMNDTLFAIAYSIQYRNRVKTGLVTYPRGYAFNGMQCLLNSGIASHYWWGKWQLYSATSLPQESAEIIPKNEDGSDSTFPRFSVKLNGNTQMWYHTAGVKIGQPILFNDLSVYFNITTDLNLTEYGNWAVTTADYDSYQLTSKTGCQLQNILIKWFEWEFNLNYSD